MALPGLPTLNDLVQGARNLCKIKETFAKGSHISALGGLFDQDVWPGFISTTWYINASDKDFDICNINLCNLPENQIRTETRAANISPFPEVIPCCSDGSKCCINATPQNMVLLKKSLEGIIKIFEKYVSGLAASKYREGIRKAFTGSCSAINEAILLVNAKGAKSPFTTQPFNVNSYNDRCYIKNQLNNSFPPPDGLIKPLQDLIADYSAIIDGYRPGWLIFCECCDCIKASPFFKELYPPGDGWLTPKQLCNNPNDPCTGEDITCAQGGNGGTVVLPGEGAADPYKPAYASLANWSLCRQSVIDGYLSSNLNCQTSLQGSCIGAYPSVWSGIKECENLPGDPNGFYEQHFNPAMGATNCCALCTCEELCPIYGENCAAQSDLNFLTNCTNSGGTIYPLSLNAFLSNKCRNYELGCIQCITPTPTPTPTSTPTPTPTPTVCDCSEGDCYQQCIDANYNPFPQPCPNGCQVQLGGIGSCCCYWCADTPQDCANPPYGGTPCL